MSTLNVNNINEAGGVDAVITAGVLDSGSLPVGTILQVVRATDATRRSTTSTSFVDASISVSITPNSTSSRIFVLWACQFDNVTGGSNTLGIARILRAGTPLSGAESSTVGLISTVARNTNHPLFLGFDEPSTTSSVTYTTEFRTSTGTVQLLNDVNTGQMLAIEVAG